MLLIIQLSRSTYKSHGGAIPNYAIYLPLLFMLYHVEVWLFHRADENFQVLQRTATEGSRTSEVGDPPKSNTLQIFYYTPSANFARYQNVIEYTVNQEPPKTAQGIMGDGSLEVANSHCLCIFP